MDSCLTSRHSTSSSVQATPGTDATTPTCPNSASADVHSLDEKPPCCYCCVGRVQKKKALKDGSEHEMEFRSNEKRREMGVARLRSDCTTEASMSSLNDDSRSSISSAQTKSKSGKPTNKTSGSHPKQTSVTPPNNYSSSSSTDLLYRALNNDRAINDSGSSSSETDHLTSSQHEKKPRSKCQNSTQPNEPNRKRKIIHPTAQDSSVSSLNTSSSAGLARALYDSSSSSSDNSSSSE